MAAELAVAPAATPEAGSTLDVGFPYARLERAIDAFVDRPESLHTAPEIGEQIVHLVRCADRLRLEAARLVGVFAQTGEAEAQGSNDVVDWVRHHARISVAESLTLRAIGSQVDRVPASVKSLESGEIGLAHLLQIARNAAFSEKSAGGEFDEATLLERARVESVSRFRRTCLNYRHIQDQQGVVDSEVAAVECRNLTFNETDDGRYFMNVELDPLGYTAAITAIDARSDRFGADDHRDKRRRRADGLVDMHGVPCPPSASPRGRLADGAD